MGPRTGIGMGQPTHATRMQRNVRLYPWYAALLNAFFWMPVFFLYFSERLALEDVLRLEAIYYVGVVLLEVPSGHFSDTIGRRPTLMVSAAAFAAAYGLFVVGTTFAVLAAAQLCLAVGISFNSGTDTSFHFDSLDAVGRAADFAGREALVARNAFLAGALAAIVGGAVGAIDLRLAYACSLGAALAMFVLVVRFAEPTARTSAAARFGRHIGADLRACLAHLRSPALRWLFAFAVLMTVLNHIPYEFYQPYLGLLGAEMGVSARGTPISAGVHLALTMLLGSWIASRSIRVRDRIGTGLTLLAAALIQGLVIAVMSLVLHPLIALLLLARGMPRALMMAPLNAAVTPQVAEHSRATYLSIQSLAGRLAYAGVLALLSLLPEGGAGVRWPELSSMLRAGALLAAAGLVVLVLTSRAVAGRGKQGDGEQASGGGGRGGSAPANVR